MVGVCVSLHEQTVLCDSRVVFETNACKGSVEGNLQNRTNKSLVFSQFLKRFGLSNGELTGTLKLTLDCLSNFSNPKVGRGKQARAVSLTANYIFNY